MVKEMQKELKKNRMKRAVAEADLVLLLICQDNHWTLIEIDAGCKRLYVYDSQVPADVEGREKRKATANKVLEWYRDEGDMEWEKRQAKVPQQGNQEDCGVAVLMAMRRRVLIRRRPRNEREWGYGATDYPRMRWKMAEELMHYEVQWGRETVHAQTQRVMECEETE